MSDATTIVDSNALPWENGLDYLKTLTPALLTFGRFALSAAFMVYQWRGMTRVEFGYGAVLGALQFACIAAIAAQHALLRTLEHEVPEGITNRHNHGADSEFLQRRFMNG